VAIVASYAAAVAAIGRTGDWHIVTSVPTTRGAHVDVPTRPGLFDDLGES
jgi:hypothetical protein